MKTSTWSQRMSVMTLKRSASTCRTAALPWTRRPSASGPRAMKKVARDPGMLEPRRSSDDRVQAWNEEWLLVLPRASPLPDDPSRGRRSAEARHEQRSLGEDERPHDEPQEAA